MNISWISSWRPRLRNASRLRLSRCLGEHLGARAASALGNILGVFGRVICRGMG